MNSIAYLALGSNVGDRRKHLDAAIAQIHERCGIVSKTSSIYETHPLPVPGLKQGPFYNLVLELQTSLPAAELLKEILSIEDDLGREREKHLRWGPRIIDIDIIAISDCISLETAPVVPHPRYRERDFVLLPLREIAPDYSDPVSGTDIDSLIAKISPEDHTVFRRLNFNTGE